MRTPLLLFFRIAKAALLSPSRGWRRIASLHLTSRALFTRFVFPMGALTCALGLLASTVLGVSIPVWGRWHMPVLDGVAYFSIQWFWLVACIGFAARLTRNNLLALLGRDARDESMKLAAFSAVPFFLSSLAVLVPSELLQSGASITSLFGIYLFYQGIPHVCGVGGSARDRLFARVVAGTAAFSMALMLSISACCFPSYSLFSLTFVPMTKDVRALKDNMRELERLSVAR